MPGVGIDDIAIYFPKLYFDMKDFAEFRGADFGKLNKGLGLTAMAIPDAHEDTATTVSYTHLTLPTICSV